MSTLACVPQRVCSIASITHVSHSHGQFELGVHSSNGGIGQVGAVHQRYLNELISTGAATGSLRQILRESSLQCPTYAVHDSDDRHQPPIEAVDNLLLLSRCKIVERIVFGKLPLIITLLTILHVRDLLLFAVVLRSDGRLQTRHIGGVLRLARLALVGDQSWETK